MEEDCLPWQAFECSFGRTVAEDLRLHEPTEVKTGPQRYDFSWMYSSETGGEEGSDAGTTFRDFLKSPGRTKWIPDPEIPAAAAEHALDRQAWWDVT
eukprot:365142-Chlamydomonas_euryale.AAC.4